MDNFQSCAELYGNLRDRFVAELRESDQQITPFAGEVLGMLAGMVTRNEHLGAAVDRLQRSDKPAYEAFMRALEQS